MDYKKIAGIIEAIAVAQNSAHTRTEEAQNAGAILKACSFGVVLTPIPNAKATVAALDAITSKRTGIGGPDLGRYASPHSDRARHA